MTETFNENVLIDGSSDESQLRVQGHTTQTEPLQTWEGSSGDTLAQITGDGRLQVGDDVGLASPDALMEAHRAEGSTSKPKRAFHALGRVSDALDSIAQWIVEELEVHGSDSLSALQTALRVRAANMNMGTPTAGAELRAADIEVSNDATAGSATLPKATGLQVSVTNASGKTIDQAIGVHVKLDNAGTITNPYAIYTEGEGAAHFDDYLEVKRPAVVPGTPATDLIRIYPKSDGNLYAKNWGGVESQVGGASFDTQSANVVFAGPSSGGAAIPAFRALVPDDIPSLDANKLASGVLDNVRVNWGAPDDIGTVTRANVLTNQLIIQPNSAIDSNVFLQGDAETNRVIYFRTGSSHRWSIYTNAVAETGSNAGSDFLISRYSDNGDWLNSALHISRANGFATFHAGTIFIRPNGLTHDTTLEIGEGRTANGYALIDLTGDTTYTDYGLRIIRDNTGANAFSHIVQRGTGSLRFEMVDGAAAAFYVTDTTTSKFFVYSGGASVNGSLSISGALYKGSGTFRIDHPLDPQNKLLYHGFVEAPRYDLIYRGKVQLKDGAAAVSIDKASNMSDGTFEVLTQNAQVYLQNDTGFTPVKGIIEQGELTIESQDSANTDTISWLVIGERADRFIKSTEISDEDGRLIPEWVKPAKPESKTDNTDSLKGLYKGELLHPIA